MDYLDGLNKEQREAVETTDGPILILAGAGSGKTRVVTNKIAYLIEKLNVFPSNILALTFTNKAADEMKTRVGDLLNKNVDPMWIGTFHSICVRILRRDIDKIGYETGFTIYDRTDQDRLVKECMDELDISSDRINKSLVLSRISNLKAEEISPDDYIKSNGHDFLEEEISKIYKLYQKKIKEYNALDFDDLLYKTVELLENEEDILEYYSEKFQYIFVDEYQDTNKIQYRLVRLLSQTHNNICVVGDTDQSIYGWRGADIRNIKDFEKDYKDAKVIKLEQNYRSTQPILNVANEVIKNNYGLKGPKRLWTETRGGGPVEYEELPNGEEEAYFVASKIQELVSKRRHKYSDIAVLYRTNAQSRSFEDAFMRRKIPFKIVGGLRFYDRMEVKDIIAYLKVLQNPIDNISVKRIINTPKRGIGNATIEKLEEYSLSNGISMYEAILHCDEIDSISTRGKNSLKEFKDIINLLIAKKELLSIDELILEVIELTEYIERLEKEDTLEARARIDNIQEFVNVVADFLKDEPDAGLEEFLSRVSLMSDVDKTEDEDGVVTLMTIHSAKGLEFPVVFLVGLEEGLLPNGMALNSGNEEEIEEERRLCYVAVTRAEEELYLTSARERFIYGQRKAGKLSRFVEEMGDSIRDNTLRSTGNLDRKDRIRRSIDIEDFTPSLDHVEKEDMDNFNLGDKLSHKLWGEGMVVEVSGEGSDQTVVVAFENKGLKKLDPSIAPIKKI